MNISNFTATPGPRSILVTGATGFIGRSLLKKLAQGSYDIIACYRTPKTYEKNKIDSDNINYFNLDLTNKRDFEKITQSVDTVVHLASQVFRSGGENSFEGFISNNVLGTHNLLEFCQRKNVRRIIYLSSKYVYGEPEIDKVDETYPARPCGTFFNYGMSKLICEHLCIRYCHDYHIESVILRLSPVYGEEQGEWCLLPRLVNQVRDKQSLTLYGDGANIMEYLYIDDGVAAIMSALDTPHQGIYNIGPGKSLTFKELVDQIVKAYSPDQAINVRYEPQQKPSEKGFILDISQAEAKLGFKPKYTFKNGLVKLNKRGVYVVSQ
jgi:nucleoside-diphosphate-sugar epimerase